MKKSLTVLLVAITLGGCVAGQTLNYDYKPTAATDKASGEVSVVVRDERTYVKDGNKGADYVGHYRAGFGNTWDVKTKGGMAFADVLARDLREEIEALGFTTGSNGRSLQVAIKEWNMDTYLNAKFWYELVVAVVGPGGETILAPQTLKEEKRIDGSIWVGPKYAVEKQMPVLYDQLVQALVRQNSEVLNALRAGP